jgi:hypothetical protein
VISQLFSKSNVIVGAPFRQKMARKLIKMLPRLRIRHQKTKTESLRIQPAMATLIFAQHNNQPTIPHH